jgi:hypothetical protein
LTEVIALELLMGARRVTPSRQLRLPAAGKRSPRILAKFLFSVQEEPWIYHVSCWSSSKTRPVGPLLSSCAKRIAMAAPWSTVRVPVNALKSVATWPGAAPFTLIGVPSRARA